MSKVSSSSSNQVLSVELVSSELTLSIHEVCQRCGLPGDDLRQLIAHGVIAPVKQTEAEWRFSAEALQLLARAARMQRDFELDAAGLAMALSLLDELQRSRREVEKLSQLLGQQLQD